MPRKVVLNVIVLMAGVIVGVLLTYRTWLGYFSLRHQVEEQKSEFRNAAEHRNDVVRRTAQVDSDSGREALARNQGWHIKGEQALDR